jgi:hypothetical protein
LETPGSGAAAGFGPAGSGRLRHLRQHSSATSIRVLRALQLSGDFIAAAFDTLQESDHVLEDGLSRGRIPAFHLKMRNRFALVVDAGSGILDIALGTLQVGNGVHGAVTPLWRQAHHLLPKPPPW